MRTRLSLAALLLFAGMVSAAEPSKFEVEVQKDVPYYTGKDADKVRHILDVYAPKGAKDAPVLFLVHGGAWKLGTKDYLTDAAKRLCGSGVCVVCPNYRLSPKVQHPAHVADVAKAFAWTADNVAKYGGSGKKIVIGGHSAGGHLAALLATDETYLKAENRSLADVRGVFGISGVYLITDHEVFHEPFGKDPAGQKAASPVAHAGPHTPPVMLVYADKDYPLLDQSAKLFATALEKAKRPVTVKEFAHRDHLTIVSEMKAADDPVVLAAKEFVEKCTAK
ncbi:MAG: alpha/beta hydrolase [Gemmataceae bacterium]